MNTIITLTIPDSAIPAYDAVVGRFNAGSGKPPVDLNGYLQILQDEQTDRHVAALKTAQREALIPVADEILAAPADKQQAAITAALNAVRA